MSHLRNEVLKRFKNLHRVRVSVFNGDDKALSAAKIQINENFKKNIEVKDPKEIEKLIKFAKEVELELKANVVQAIEKQPGVFELQIKKETLLENVLFNENAILTTHNKPKCGTGKG